MNIVNENEKLELEFLRKEVGVLQKARNIVRHFKLVTDSMLGGRRRG